MNEPRMLSPMATLTLARFLPLDVDARAGLAADVERL